LAKTDDALLVRPHDARLLYVLAHGAGAGMRHYFLAQAADVFAGRGIATYRYEFPYMQTGKSRPDSPGVAEAAVRKAVAAAAHAAPGLPLIAGGKSFGGRMTSQAQGHEPRHRVTSRYRASAVSFSSASRCTRPAGRAPRAPSI